MVLQGTVRVFIHEVQNELFADFLEHIQIFHIDHRSVGERDLVRLDAEQGIVRQIIHQLFIDVFIIVIGHLFDHIHVFPKSDRRIREFFRILSLIYGFQGFRKKGIIVQNADQGAAQINLRHGFRRR